jgi:hypothetical protein
MGSVGMNCCNLRSLLPERRMEEVFDKSTARTDSGGGIIPRRRRHAALGNTDLLPELPKNRHM